MNEVQKQLNEAIFKAASTNLDEYLCDLSNLISNHPLLRDFVAVRIPNEDSAVIAEQLFMHKRDDSGNFTRSNFMVALKEKHLPAFIKLEIDRLMKFAPPTLASNAGTAIRPAHFKKAPRYPEGDEDC